ncbi:unnamed protein product [Bursaphelenchus okinawaensis]|uniref:Uncharacterized protein n=1 Tax=Bursaphelenchus okinawaensis TaxID=465554 RepID=A0A811LF89_9BILA|nr:unnamed protein product [Bursaphelenchus okinawaensis]CAG9121200.1 unnamed protein product [Bursaphelenchus okinawaensis]
MSSLLYKLNFQKDQWKDDRFYEQDDGFYRLWWPAVLPHLKLDSSEAPLEDVSLRSNFNFGLLHLHDLNLHHLR